MLDGTMLLGAFVDEGTGRGHDAVRRTSTRREVIEALRIDPQELTDAGPAVVAHTRDTAVEGTSGVAMELDHYYAIWVRGARSGVSATWERPRRWRPSA
jgi:hypothetical protein